MNTRSVLERVIVARRILKSVERAAPASYWRDVIAQASDVLAPIPEPRASWWRRVFTRTPVQRGAEAQL